MKIPFEDSRVNMNRRWTDLRKFNGFRLHELIETIEECKEFGKEEIMLLKQTIDKKAGSLMDMEKD